MMLIQPYKLVISLGVAKGNPARVGYYSGLIVSDASGIL